MPNLALAGGTVGVLLSIWAVSLILLCAAGLFLRSLESASKIDVGFRSCVAIRWTDAKVSFECTGEMASICETYLSRDFGHRPAIQAQESFRLLQPLIHKVAMRSDPQLLAGRR